MIAFTLYALQGTDSSIIQQNYDFNKYPASIVKYKITAKGLKFTDGTAYFKTRIVAALKGNINFAGYCIFTSWGCGAPCQQSAIINTKTKKVIAGPASEAGYSFYPNSNLLISNPEIPSEPNSLRKTEIYLFESDSLRLLEIRDWKRE